METIYIHADGACSGNQEKSNFGGWGALLEYKEHKKEIYGGEKNTTNNRMEMTALIKALEAIKRDKQNIEVYSDSSYLINCFKEKWYVNWQKNGWRTSKKTQVENRDLWEKLLGLTKKHNMKFYKVKGHVNLDGNKKKIDTIYKKFLKDNNLNLSMQDFIEITEKNILADALANKGIDSILK